MNHPPAPTAVSHTRERLSHVRWIAGGTGSGKTTLATTLAQRFRADVYDGDLGERSYLPRCTPQHQPRLHAIAAMTPAQRWLHRTPAEIFESMASLHGETFGFVLDDVMAHDHDRTLIVDDFRTLPNDLDGLLVSREQAAFLIPTPEFRRTALTRRYADPDRARANWGNLDPATILEARLARDALWDAEVIRQANQLGLPLLRMDGSRSIDTIVNDLAEQFRLVDTPPLNELPRSE